MDNFISLITNKNKVQLTIFVLAVIGVAPFTIFSEVLNVDHIVFAIFYRTSFLVLCLYLLWKTDLRKLFKEKYVQLFLLFFLLYFVRVLFDTIIFPKELGFPIIKYYTFTWGVIIIPTLAFNFKLKKADLEAAFRVILPVFLTICIYSLMVSNFQFENGSVRLWGGETVHPIVLGHIAVTNIIFSIYFILESYKLKNKIFFVSNVLISLLTLSLTDSRGPIVALFILLIFYLIFIAELKKKQILLVGTISVALILSLIFFTEFYNRLVFTIHGGARIKHWSIALKQFIGSPFWGSSLEENVHKIYPHNILIESFMALGIFGGSLFLVIISKFLKEAYKILKSKNNIDKWLVLLFVQFLVSSMFSGSLITNALVWYFGIMIVSVALNKKTSPKIITEKNAIL